MRAGGWLLLCLAAACSRSFMVGSLAADSSDPAEELLGSQLTAQVILQHQAYEGNLRAAAAAAAGASRPATPVLAYVTPWNGRGYDLAKQQCRCRLDYVAPVWYQLRSTSGVLELTGGHDVDAGWVAAVRQPCPASGNVDGSGDGQATRPGPKVLPRVIFEVSGQDVLEALRQPQAVARMLVREAERHSFDGWVFEGWSYWAALGVTGHAELRQAALRLLLALSSMLAPDGRRLVVVVPPLLPATGQKALLTHADVEELLEFVDALSVMTYDYSSPQQPGPNAPLTWVQQNGNTLGMVADRLPGAPRHKILLGLPFYGQEYKYKGQQVVGADPVLASRLLQVLQQQLERQQQRETERQQQAAQEEGAGEEERAVGWGEEEEEEEGEDCSEQPRSCRSGGSSSGSGSSGELEIQWQEGSGEHVFRWWEPENSGCGSSGKKKGKGKQKGGAKKKKKRGSSKKKKAGGVRYEYRYELYFPTPLAVAQRLGLAGQLGMGASIWELGQGLPAFCGLL